MPHLAFVLAAALVAVIGPSASPEDATRFVEDFDNGLERWEISNTDTIRIIDSGDPVHGRVLELAPHDARPFALIRGSDEWRGYRIEGSFLFPEDTQNYFGFIYNLVETNDRIDLGSIYVKGNGSYIRVNPRRDWNPARSLYEEWRVNLTGDDRIQIGRWHRFAAEVIGNTCHFYVGDDPQPKATFDLCDTDRGKVGFKPRVVGGSVWLDDVTVTDIDAFHYDGPRRPSGLDYRPEEMVTDWYVLGPLTQAYDAVEKSPQRIASPIRDDGEEQHWKKFQTDARGAVITGRITEFLGDHTVAYFSTTIHVDEGQQIELQVSTIDDLAVWVNGRFKGYYGRNKLAWYDFGRNPQHPFENYPLVLPEGDFHVLFRVRGGVYASGGFFLRPVRR